MKNSTLQTFIDRIRIPAMAMELEVVIEWNQFGLLRLSSSFLDEDLLARFASVAQCKQEVVLDCHQRWDWRMPPSSGGDSGSWACGAHLVDLALPIWWACFLIPDVAFFFF